MMTDIVLITPPFKYAKLEEAAPACPPLGLAYIASALEQENYSVKLIDARALEFGFKEIFAKIKEQNPRVVGITAVTAEFPAVVAIAKIIKKRLPDVVVVLGGPHPSIMPETCNLPEIDYLVMGEGERTAVELMDYIFKSRGELGNIRGLAYRAGGKLRINAARELIENLDELPFPAYHLLPMNLYKAYAIYDVGYRFTTLITSRGCPYQCIYCTSSQVFGKRWRAMSAKKVFELLVKLNKEYGIRHFYFQDDEFTINKDRVKEICGLIIKSRLHGKIIWECLSRVSDVNDELLDVMYKGGCRGIVYGVECGYDEGLRLIKKGITLEQVRRAIELTKKHSIHARASFIMGFPWESKEEIKKTVRFAKSLAPDIVYFQVLIPYPKTELYDTIKKEGLIVSNDWSQYVQHSIVGTKPIIKTRHLSNKELQTLNSKAYLSFYLSPKTIMNRFFSKRSPKNSFKRTVKAGFGLVRNATKTILRR